MRNRNHSISEIETMANLTPFGGNNSINLEIGKVTYNSVEVSWDADKNNNEKRVLYHVQLNKARRAPSPGAPALDPLTNYQGYGQNHEFKGLDPNTEYVCQLRVVEEGEKPGSRPRWGIPVSVSTAKEPPSGAELHRAVQKHDVEKVRKILEENNSVVEVMDKLGNTPLMICAEKGFTDIMELLLEFGADPEYINSSGKSAVMVAAYYGQEEAMELMHGCGVSWVSRDKNGLTPVHWAADGGHDDLLNWMLKKGAPVDVEDLTNGWTPLMRVACLSGNDDVAETLITKGAKVNQMDKSGKTVLMAAAMNGHFALVRMLVEKGADIYLKNKEGKTALEFARSFDRHRIIKYLEYKVAAEEKQRKEERKAKLMEENRKASDKLLGRV